MSEIQTMNGPGLVRSLRDEFVRAHGTPNAAELLARATIIATEERQSRTLEHFAKRPCARFALATVDAIELVLSRERLCASEGQS